MDTTMLRKTWHDTFAGETGKASGLSGNTAQAETMPVLTRLVGPGAARRSS